MSDTTKIDAVNVPPRRFSGMTIAGAIVLVVGVANFALAILGSGREGAGGLFFGTEKVGYSIADAVKAIEPFEKVCADPEADGAFDQSSVKEFRSWCRSVDALASEKTPAEAVRLLRAQNRHFTKITDRMLNKGGRPGELGTLLLEGGCQVRPPLEDVFNQTAGAAFSQAIIGLLLLGIGGWMVRRGRRRTKS